MSVVSYLDKRASQAILPATEERSINTSVTTIGDRLASHFGQQLKEQFRFGSSTRGTILPRSMDEHSDIDYMVVLDNDGSTPQTYLDRVKRFSEKYYSRSEIKQSSPSIVLELNHIKFDLVPAIKSWLGGYQIVGDGNSWRSTDPNDFNRALTEKNNSELFKIKPTIRLAKFWNAQNGYVFDSFEFEKWIVDRSFWFISNQRDYLFKVFDDLSAWSEQSQWRRDRIQRAKDIIARVREYEVKDMPVTAESEVKKLIPE